MSTRKIPGSKAGQGVRLTTYHLHVPNVKKIRDLNLPDLPWACSASLAVNLPTDTKGDFTTYKYNSLIILSWLYQQA
jgi:hypothetical protein